MRPKRRTIIKLFVAVQAAVLGGDSIREAALAVTTAYRPFTTDSFWNQPLPATAPIDSESAKFIANVKANSGDHMKFTMGNFAQPFYFAQSTDPLQTVTDSHGRTVSLHVPKGAAPMDGSDAEFTVFDQSTNNCVGFHWASIDSSGKIHCDGLDRWHLSSNGLDGSMSQSNDRYNTGHRGSPASTRGIRVDEVKAGAILHKVSTFWFATGESHCFPMAGHESGKGGIVPEGICLRIKRSVDVNARISNPIGRIIAKSWQDYGVYVGDNSGSGSRVKLERSSAWAGMGIGVDSLSAIKWDDWEFIKRGFGA